MRARKHGGITLVETMVTALVITLLMGLYLPCLKNQDEKEKLEECQQRMRVISLAAHNFHMVHRRLPPATLGFGSAVTFDDWNDNGESREYWTRTQNTSALALVMPYMELGAIYRRVSPIAFEMDTRLDEHPDAEDPAFEWQGIITGIQEACVQEMDQFVCPADNINTLGLRPIIATQPCVPYGEDNNDIAVQLWPELESVEPMFTNYIAVGGALGGKAFGEEAAMHRWLGAMSSRRRIVLEAIPDGTSHTMMFGETLGGIDDGRRQTGMSWMWGGMGRARGDIPAMRHDDPHNDMQTMLGTLHYSSPVGFGSAHEKAVVFALCDGSIHAISFNINWMTLYELAGANDGSRLGGR